MGKKTKKVRDDIVGKFKPLKKKRKKNKKKGKRP